MLSRRHVLAASALAAAPPAAAQAADMFEASTLEADLRAYAAFGDHQSGGPGDVATGRWVSARLAASGYRMERQVIRTPFFDAAQAYVAWEAARLDGVPQHPVTPAPGGALQAPLALRRDARDDAALQGRIAVVVLPYARHSSLTAPAVLDISIKPIRVELK